MSDRAEPPRWDPEPFLAKCTRGAMVTGDWPWNTQNDPDWDDPTTPRLVLRKEDYQPVADALVRRQPLTLTADDGTEHNAVVPDTHFSAGPGDVTVSSCVLDLRRLHDAVAAHREANLARATAPDEDGFIRPAGVFNQSGAAVDAPATRLAVRGCVVTSAKFSDLDIACTLSAAARFAWAAGFDAARFAGAAWFDAARFAGHAGFGAARFAGAARFGAARFAGHAGFGAARFAGHAGFDAARFAGHAGFGAARFDGDARFGAARFDGDAWFGDANFKRTAEFGSATFEKDAGFGSANFEKDASFGSATFEKDAEFGSATFKRTASFGSATFKRTARFGSANFEKDASFGGARFFAPAHFRETRFHGPTKFVGARVYNDMTFENARFVGGAWFDRIRVRRSATLSFPHTQFAEMVTFNGALVFGRVMFTDATADHRLVFEPWVDKDHSPNDPARPLIPLRLGRQGRFGLNQFLARGGATIELKMDNLRQPRRVRGGESLLQRWPVLGRAGEWLGVVRPPPFFEGDDARQPAELRRAAHDYDLLASNYRNQPATDAEEDHCRWRGHELRRLADWYEMREAWSAARAATSIPKVSFKDGFGGVRHFFAVLWMILLGYARLAWRAVSCVLWQWFIKRTMVGYVLDPARPMVAGLVVMAVCAGIYWLGIREGDIAHGSYVMSSSFLGGSEPDREAAFAYWKSNPWNPVYLSLTTFVTLGYGDFAPAAGWLKLVTGLQALLGVTLLALFTVAWGRKMVR